MGLQCPGGALPLMLQLADDNALGFAKSQIHCRRGVCVKGGGPRVCAPRGQAPAKSKQNLLRGVWWEEGGGVIRVEQQEPYVQRPSGEGSRTRRVQGAPGSGGLGGRVGPGRRRTVA